MSRYNLQSLSFALIVLVFVLFGKHGNGEAGVPVTSGIERTSLTAEAFREEEVRPAKIDFPELQAKTATVVELGTHTPLFSKGFANRWPIASITKLMTALIAIDALDPSAVVTISERAAAESGDVGNFRAGEMFTVLDLLKAMLVGSSNDAAVALAEIHGYDAFLDAMREKAFALGMSETTFIDPSGISVLNQSTAEDLTKLANFISAEQQIIFDISSLSSAQIIERNSGSARAILTTNLFAGTKDFIGGKTGYTSDANGNLLSIFSDGNQKFLIIVLGTSDRFGETETLWRWVQKTIHI